MSTYKKQEFYTNYSSPMNNVTVVSLYGDGIYVLPRQPFCSKYCVPMSLVGLKNKVVDAQSRPSYYGYELSKTNIDFSEVQEAIKNGHAVRLFDKNARFAANLSNYFNYLLAKDITHDSFKLLSASNSYTAFNNMIETYGLK